MSIQPDPASQKKADKEAIFENDQILTETDFREVIDYLHKEGIDTNDRALKAIAESERYLQQAYAGRYLFELIQNVRDANRKAGVDGSVFIEITENAITISNTGSPFSKKGIKSITTIGDSTKDSREFIGFKGIGFKSVQEVSEQPYIVTRFGTLRFDRDLSWPFLADELDEPEQVPLFFIPHFSSERLTDDDLSREIVTKVVLPLKPGVDEANIDGGFEEIQLHQLVLLGNLRYLEFKKEDELRYYQIDEHKSTGRVTVSSHVDAKEFKHFSSVPILIPDTIIEKLEKKEKALFEKDPNAEISLIFDLSDIGRLQPIENANLYLYYPLKLESGFKFLIHSCFIVNPERTDLMNNALNRFLLTQIGFYLANDWLTVAKKSHRTAFIHYLAFQRNTQRPILNHLYDALINELDTKRFIWDKVTETFYRVNEVMIGDGFDRGLFEDNKIDGKPIVYVDDKNTVAWLKKEFKIDYLSYETIKLHIEKECRRQAKKNNYRFFNNLYRYLVEHDGLNLRDCNVLLTSNNKLMSSDDHVFYGMSSSSRRQLPPQIARKIYFAHPEIKISVQRQGKGQTGFLEFNTELLVGRLLDLYGSNVPNEDILKALLTLDIKERLFPQIRAKVKILLLNGQWINPLQTPAYLPTPELYALYEDSKFVDMSFLESLNQPESLIKQRLISFGIWDIPAIYYSKKTIQIRQSDDRFQILYNQRAYSTAYFELSGDWLIDLPAEPNKWFSAAIFSNWQRYTALIDHEDSPSMKFRSQTSNLHEVSRSSRVFISGFLHGLKTKAWLSLPGSSELYRPEDIIGIDAIDYHGVGGHLYKKYLAVYQLNYTANLTAIGALKIRHLDTVNIYSWKVILSNCQQRHAELDVNTKEFILFYNRLLNKLFDFYEYHLKTKDDIRQFTDTLFLAVNELSGQLSWQKAQTIFYLDDKPSYDILPEAIKMAVQPQFVNKDKNRFGKIAAVIGLSFRQTIVQELTDETYIHETTFNAFFPRLAQSLALAEQVLGITLQREMERIKQVRLLIKNTVRVRVLRRGQLIQELDVNHKIIGGRGNLIYTVAIPESNRPRFFAHLLFDYLTEWLGRDLQILQNLLTDFLSRSDTRSFLETYGVENARVEEIKEIFEENPMSNQQRFWQDILKASNKYDDTIYSPETEYLTIGPLLGLTEDEMKEFQERIDTEDLCEAKNLETLLALFSRLGISIRSFNEVASRQINFASYYARRFEGFKLRYKAKFESALYEYLDGRELTEQSKFQDIVDSYLHQFAAAIPEAVLTFDVDEHFRQRFAATYPLIEDKFVQGKLIDLVKLFQKNLKQFKQQLVVSSLSTSQFEEFVSYNINRSLIYFGKYEILVAKYKQEFNEIIAPAEDSNVDPLLEYQNSADIKIQTSSTQAVVARSESGGSDSNDTEPGDKRYDGAEQSPQKQLIGVVSEKMVYEALLNKYQQVEWLSKNAARAGVNPEGHDRWGFDIRYVDDQDNVHYVEVKGKSLSHRHFYITYPEVQKANKEKEFYHVFFVTNALDNKTRLISDLGNLFMLGELEDIFNNQKFTAKFNVLEISFN